MATPTRRPSTMTLLPRRLVCLTNSSLSGRMRHPKLVATIAARRTKSPLTRTTTEAPALQLPSSGMHLCGYSHRSRIAAMIQYRMHLRMKPTAILPRLPPRAPPLEVDKCLASCRLVMITRNLRTSTTTVRRKMTALPRSPQTDVCVQMPLIKLWKKPMYI